MTCGPDPVRSDPGEIHLDAACNSARIKTHLSHIRAKNALAQMKKSFRSFTNTGVTRQRSTFFFSSSSLHGFETLWKLEVTPHNFRHAGVSAKRKN